MCRWVLLRDNDFKCCIVYIFVAFNKIGQIFRYFDLIGGEIPVSNLWRIVELVTADPSDVSVVDSLQISFHLGADQSQYENHQSQREDTMSSCHAQSRI